ncbi:MAG: 50S ribosomal protein L1 [Parachlamydiales bacterium]|nr:50S ribosomal protein L1 [Verrucomicrobiota bacterium]MBX3719735.1 50S ribosomal protein L1 [Candidatus Acheromyda pituitae]
MHRSKRFREIDKSVDRMKVYSLAEAIEILQKCPPVKFDQSVELSLKTGVDAQKSDQQVRGTVSLPNGTGKRSTILVFAKGEKVKEALDAGADYAGNEEYFEKIKNGWTDFTAVIATPDMMRDVGKLGKVLGPRGLMPTPKGGTVTTDVAKAVAEVKAGKIEFKSDKHGVINTLVGKISFNKEKLVENIIALLSAITRSKPSTAKGQYLKSMALSSTMGPGLKIDLSSITEIHGAKE